MWTRGYNLATDFRPSDYQKSRFAHDLFPKYFKKIKAIPNPKRREVDFHLYLDDKLVGYAELEVKFVWKTKEWTNYPNIQFPARKAHFAQTELPTFMVMFNSDGSNALIVDAKTMAASPLVNRWTRRGKDFLYQVPLNKVVFGPESFERYVLERVKK